MRKFFYKNYLRVYIYIYFVYVFLRECVCGIGIYGDNELFSMDVDGGIYFFLELYLVVRFRFQIDLVRMYGNEVKVLNLNQGKEGNFIFLC